MGTATVKLEMAKLEMAGLRPACGQEARGSGRIRTAGVPPAPSGRTAEGKLVWRSRGCLPHIDAPNLVQHVVFRLADSLPLAVRDEVMKMRPEHGARAIDAALDAGHGRRDLAIPPVAALVQVALLNFDAERYSLLAWCIMPNRVHVLPATKPDYPLDRVVHSWKSYTAKQANRLLGRTEPFWAPEYFDRFMRDDEHLARTAAYIEGNPLKAGLCENISDRQFSSAWQGWSGRDARGPDTSGPETRR
jgi:REP element-mobilizing transposase RayT